MYIGATINESPVIAGIAGAAISAGAGKAVKRDGNGKIVLCSAAGELAEGILLLDTPDSVAVDEEITVQIKAIGQAIAGAQISAGAEVTTNADGKLVPAVAATFSVAGAVATVATKNYVLGYAKTASAGDGSIFEVDIRKSGYKL